MTDAEDHLDLDAREIKELDKTYRELYVTYLRELIGKTDDINVPLCQHAFILSHEMAQKGIIICRVCSKPLHDGDGRYNDHLILRNRLCVQPICLKCAEERPDIFHRNFKKGVELMNMEKELGSNIPLDAARILTEQREALKKRRC